ncbi:MAG: GTP cyclohydrolase I FolE [Bacteroidales bacterium]|jgi:GTP cyclohydrolase I|nr:GTP cyclohydrolase I FolE [Bacteroidales bacterium]
MIELTEKGAEYNEGTRYIKVEKYNEESTNSIATSVKNMLVQIGEDPSRDGIKDTPMRVAKAMQFCTQGYQIDPKKILEGALFKEDYSQMVLVKNIELYSMCEHHLLPFFGKAHVAYIPNGTITGLSKIARVVDAYARRLQVQERLTMQIRDCLQEALHPWGVAVVIEASHLCMMMRGVQKQNSVTTTSAFTGAFLKNTTTREEFLRLINVNLH